MRLMLTLVITCFFIAFSYSAEQANAGYSPIHLGVPHFIPYTYQLNGNIEGRAVLPVSRALDALAVPFTFKLYDNYSLLLKALKKNEIDGFFLASQNKERDRYADFSKAFTLNNWSWFYLKENIQDVDSDEFKRNAHIATIEKTNTYRWLVRNGYQVTGYPANQLPLLLSQKKVDAIFAAQAVFEQSAKKAALSPSVYKIEIKVSKPFGMYVSKKYLNKHPDFLQKLNEKITTK